ncbi:MAG: cytochrome-c peroxidase [Bacteroidota bacterium]
MRSLAFLLVAVWLLNSCAKEKVGYQPTPYALEIPSHFPSMNIPADNPMTVEGVELGRYLFYEKRLSGNDKMSCASCHSSFSSFSDSAKYSTGIDGIQGNRNAMALINLGWDSFFFWDGRANSLEHQILEPVPNPIEMHLSWKEALSKLKKDTYYRNQFYKAFGVVDFDSTHAAKAIAQFIRTMISGRSKYDVMYKIENNLPLSAWDQSVQITNEEWAGYDLFKSLNGADCFHCHNGPLMRVAKFSNNGLDASFSDLGRGAVTTNANDNGKFKVPTLRNIALTAPYMHDGRFKTLDEVIEHYSSGVHMSPTIDPLIEFANQGGVQLDAQEKQLLKTFLMTLTDLEFVNNPKFQDPN